MFADISGFTMISEACASKGVRGNEELAFCINGYMEGIVKSLAKYGGDIIKFVGDAMIIMWPPSQAQDRENNSVRKAVQCAWDIQSELNNKKVNADFQLSVKVIMLSLQNTLIRSVSAMASALFYMLEEFSIVVNSSQWERR